jgi:hypothetical protein
MRVPPLAQESAAADGEAEPIHADDADSEAMPADRAAAITIQTTE